MKKLSEVFKPNKVEVDEYPPVSSLGDGQYSGIMSGYVFEYNGKSYKSDFGVRGINCKVTLTVKDGKQEETWM